MKWFKHMTRSLNDSKIEKLIMKFGIEGYGVYFGILETIAGHLTSDNVKFEIDHGIELLAHKWKIDTIKLGHILQECFDLGLLELLENGNWACYKIVKYVDDSLSRNPEIRKMCKNPEYLRAKQAIGISGDIGDPEETSENPEETPKDSDQTRLDKTRLEKEVKETIYFELSYLLYQLHKKHDNKYRVSDSTLTKWADSVRLLVEKDGRDTQDVRRVIEWVKHPDNFWFSNIMSGKKLREKFPTLLHQSSSKEKKSFEPKVKPPMFGELHDK